MSTPAQSKLNKMLLGPNDKAELKDHRKKVFGFGVATALLGGFLVLVTLSAESRVRQTAEWPSVQGIITTAEEDTAVSRTGRKTVSERIAKIEYRYIVDGQDYKGSRRRVVPMFHFSEDTDNVLKRYRKGMGVTVFYDPSNPADSLLQNTATDQAQGLIRGILYGAMFGGFIGLVIIFSSVSAFLPEKAGATQSTPQVQTTKPKGPKRWPMPIRVLTVIVGGPIALLGILLVVNSLSNFGTTEHGTLVDSITMMVMAGITFFGGYLTWLGVSKNGKGQMPTA